MINRISFTGREGLLTNTINKARKVENNYVGEGKIYPKKVIREMKAKAEELKAQNMKQPVYTSPYAPINEKSAASVDFVSEFMPHGIDYKA